MAELVDNGVTAVVLGIGMQRQLSVMVETLDLLESRGMAVHVLETREAVRVHNELAASTRVGALPHSTC
ncbi:MTH938/NDUFAF3 family protein [Micromonospora sp. NPDC050397]|uniref:MTH938/NDUFAF3 family protein n=1 Tax=Micromonospora sp. NPDC050397 TaxID=3364279 RepID=UPI00384F7084